MVEYNNVNGKLSDSQLKTGATLRISKFLMKIIYLMNCY